MKDKMTTATSPALFCYKLLFEVVFASAKNTIESYTLPLSMPIPTPTQHEKC